VGLRGIKNLISIGGDYQTLFPKMFGNITLARVSSRLGRLAGADSNLSSSTITIYDAAAGGIPISVIHEFGHFLMIHNPNGDDWGEDFMSATDSKCNLRSVGHCWLGYQAGGTTTEYGKTDLGEDFADSFARTTAKFDPAIPVFGITENKDDIDSKRFDFIMKIIFAFQK
jgi:hypothetical protein